MASYADRPFPERGSNLEAWYRRGLTPPWVIEAFVRERVLDQRLPKEPTYDDFLRDSDD